MYGFLVNSYEAMSKCPRCAIYLVESFQVKIIHVGHFVEIGSCSLHQWTLGDASFVQLDAIMTTPTFFLQRRHQLVRGTPRKTNGWNRENHLFGRENHLNQTFGSLGFQPSTGCNTFPLKSSSNGWLVLNYNERLSIFDGFGLTLHQTLFQKFTICGILITWWTYVWPGSLCVFFLFDHCLHPVIWQHTHLYHTCL